MIRFRVILLLAGLAFGVTLAVVVGVRLSAEAMAVVIGVIAGVAASVPTSLIVVWFALRALGSREPPAAYVPPAYRQPETEQPRIVVVTAPPAPPVNPHSYAPPAAYAPPFAEPAGSLVQARAPRHFAIIGGLDDASLDDPQR